MKKTSIIGILRQWDRPVGGIRTAGGFMALNSARSRSGKAAYLAVRADVEAKIAKGICILEIFEEYRENMPIGYSQFARYVQRYSEHAKFDLAATPHGGHGQ